MKELKSQLQAASEEKQRLEAAQESELAVLRDKQEEGVSLVSRLTGERDGLRARLVELEDAREVSLSEVASLQSDLATLRSEQNTQKMSVEEVSE